MRAILIIGVVLVAAGAGLGAQDPLSAAKDLYASAAYEDALSTLSRMDGGSTAPEIARQVDEYRAFCLYALGRTREAESDRGGDDPEGTAGAIGRRRRVAAPRIDVLRRAQAAVAVADTRTVSDGEIRARSKRASATPSRH